MQGQRVGKIIKQRVERARKRREETGDRERQPDVALDRNAEKSRPPLVLADRKQRAAEWRSQQKTHQADRGGEDRQQEIIEGRTAFGNVQNEWGNSDCLAMEVAQAVKPAGDAVPTVSEVIPKLAKRDGAHREIDAAAAHDQKSKQVPANPPSSVPAAIAS